MMKDNALGIVVGGSLLFWWQWLGGSLLLLAVALLVGSAAMAGLYSATGYRAHRFALISLALGALALVVGQAVAQ